MEKKRMEKRYEKHILLKEVGKEGQKKLMDSKAIIIGCGATGSAAAINLVRSGFGEIVIADRDVVDEGNLQRQFLFNEEDIGKEKALVAERKLKKMNSLSKVKGIIDHICSSNIEKLIEGKDIVLDCTDNMETRFLINDACVKKGITWIYCGAIATYGMVKAIIPKKTACLRCMFPSIPANLPTCDTAGILTPVPIVLASIQSTLAIKYIVEGSIDGNLIMYDPWYNYFEVIEIKKRKGCKCCGKGIYDFLEEKEKAIKLCGKEAIIIVGKERVSFPLLQKKLKKFGKVKKEGVVLKFYEKNHEIHIFESGRAIIYGTDDEEKAKSLYEKYVKII
ncbi:MAG: NAD(P)H-binding protein [Thermoplasmata archaeon]|nr:MAG: NAD(P)H-binding protein [Thermoplasmata archaeon]